MDDPASTLRGTDTTSAPIISLTYVSSASRLLDESALHEMLVSIRAKNAAREITGMLLYAGGNIIQTIEGRPGVVDPLFGTILTDPRHKQVLMLLREEIDERGFPDWSMGYRGFTAREGEGYTAFLHERFRSPGPHRSGSAHLLLENFREHMR